MSQLITFDQNLDINALDELVECYAGSLCDRDPTLKMPYAHFMFQQEITKKMRNAMRCREEEYTLVKAYTSQGNIAGFALAHHVQCNAVNFFHIKCLCSRQEFDDQALPTMIDKDLLNACIANRPENTQIITVLCDKENRDVFHQYGMVNSQTLLGSNGAKAISRKDLFNEEKNLMACVAGYNSPATQYSARLNY